jgi:type IV pilus assembly protein PilB
MTARERIGDMLVTAGLVTQRELDEALIAQQRSNLRIGKQLVELGYVAEMQLTQVLSNQLSVPWVSLDRIEFSSALLERISGELADRLTVMPIYVRSVREQGDTLYVAMDDPTNEDAIQQIARAARLPVRPMIAAPSELRRAIEARYFGGEEVPATAGPVLAADDLRPRRRSKRPPRQPPKKDARAKPPPPPKLKPVITEGAVSMEQYEIPSEPPQGGSRRTLTLLDGTRVALPAAGRGGRSLDATEVRHIVKAVRRAAADLGLAEAPRWHDVVQVVLDVLASRGVKLSRKEIQEAWAKRYGSSEREP